MDDSFVLGLQVAVVGMATVILGLGIVWASIKLLVALDRPSAAETPPVTPALPAAQPEMDPALLTAIALAIITHEAVRRKQAAPVMRTHWPGSQPSRWLVVGRTRQNRSWRSS